MTKQKDNAQAVKIEQAPAIKASTDIAIPEHVADPGWGAVEGLETTDLQVPKIFHQQALSKFVSEGVARPGDFCDSLTGEVLCKKEDKLEVIVFGSYKNMIVKELDPTSKQWKLKEIILVTLDNAKELASKPRHEATSFGENLSYEMQYNYYCLLPSRINELPFILSLGGTKVRAAKTLNTMFYKLSSLRRPGASVVFTLESTPEKNEKGSWFGLKISQGRDSSAAELLRAHAWYQKSKSQKITAVEDDAQDENDDVPF